MIKKEYHNLNPLKFHDELITAGINPTYVGNGLPAYTGDNPQERVYIADNVEIWLEDDTDVALVDQLAANHDPTPLPPLQTENQVLGQMITDMELAGIIQGQQATDLELRLLALEAKANV